MKKHLRSARLTLIPFGSSDLNLLHRRFSDPLVRKYLWDDEIITLEQARKILLTNEQNIQDNKWGLWKVVRKDDKVTSALPAYGPSLMKISPN